MGKVSPATLADEVMHGVAPWIAAAPSDDNLPGRAFVSGDIVDRLQRLGFDTRMFGPPPGIIVATRDVPGSLRLGMVGHYDVERVGDGWTVPPLAVTHMEGRLYARGIADNLGPLWLRIAALEKHRDPTPSLLIVLQGEEEAGSPTAHRLFPELTWPHVDLWIEETGYFELDGTQRLLVRNLDQIAEPLVAAVEAVALEHGRASRRHDRYLNKAFGTDRCPFLTHLIKGGPYIAIGPNDPRSAIHGADESLPVGNLDISERQFHAILIAAAENVA